MKKIMLFLLIAVTAATSGCSSSPFGENKPSHADGLKAVEHRFARFKSIVKVKSFKQTNGVMNEGKNRYTMEYEVELEFLQDVKPPRWALDAFNTMFYGRRAGEVVKQQGRFEFELTEKGWRPRLLEQIQGSPY